MENLDEATKRITSAMVQISEIITTSGMSGICILHKGKGNVMASPLLIQGTTLDIIPAVVSVMKKPSSSSRNITYSLRVLQMPRKRTSSAKRYAGLFEGNYRRFV